jgi:hypothetical protein
MNVARLSTLRTGCLYPWTNNCYTFLLEAASTQAPQCDRMYNGNENALTVSGIEPANFRFVAQWLNHYTAAYNCMEVVTSNST